MMSSDPGISSDSETSNDPGITSDPAITSAIVLLPSDGLGGGIESYAEGVLGSLRDVGIDVEVLALLDANRPTVTRFGKVRFTWRAVRLGTSRSGRSRLFFVLHPSFAVIGLVVDALRMGRRPRPTVFFHGIDIWDCPRWTRALLRRRGLPVVTVSSFSAGALAGMGMTVPALMPPTISRSRYESLTAVSRVRTAADLVAAGILTVCRLEQAEGKGVRTLIEAAGVVRVCHPTARLVVAGRGPAPEWLLVEANRRPWLQIVQSPSPSELEERYRSAALFVLATRTGPSAGPHRSGEGFGLVLAEAQLTGLPVISPARGGSADAILDGITGRRPFDESVEALAATINSLLSDSESYSVMSANALVWARRAFAPQRGVDALLNRLTGEGGTSPLELILRESADAEGTAPRISS